MSSRSVKVNTFFQQKPKPSIDVLSKCYIVISSILGLIRLPVVLNKAKFTLTAIAVLFSVFLTTGTSYIMCMNNTFIYVIPAMSLIQYMFVIIFSFLTLKRVEHFYNELNAFDVEIGCRPKTTTQTIKNFIAMVVTNVLFTISYVCIIQSRGEFHIYFQAIPKNLLHCIELSYYGHLLSLLVPRLRLINYFLETELSNSKAIKIPNVEEFRSFKSKQMKNTDVKTLMDLYYIVTKAFDFLIDAIKWQLLVILITSFISSLFFCYSLAEDLTHDQLTIVGTITSVYAIMMEMIPLFSPCLFSDRVHGEVRWMRELLASRLYENKLDKWGRSSARALVALTEAKDLSFSLLRMLQIDVSLPFKFIGLLLTYLIIMMQFEKVISPQDSELALNEQNTTT